MLCTQNNYSRRDVSSTFPADITTLKTDLHGSIKSEGKNVTHLSVRWWGGNCKWNACGWRFWPSCASGGVDGDDSLTVIIMLWRILCCDWALLLSVGDDTMDGRRRWVCWGCQSMKTKIFLSASLHFQKWWDGILMDSVFLSTNNVSISIDFSSLHQLRRRYNKCIYLVVADLYVLPMIHSI